MIYIFFTVFFSDIEESDSVCESHREAEKLMLTNDQVDAMRMSLTKICLVRSPTSPPLNPITVYRDIMHAYHLYRELDALLSSFYFNTPALLDVIAVIRSSLKREKTAKLARKVLEKYQLNARHVGGTDRPTQMAGDVDAHNEVVAVAMTDGEPDIAAGEGCTNSVGASEGNDNIPAEALHNGTAVDMEIGDVPVATEPAKDGTDDAGQSPDDAVTTDHDDVAHSSTLSQKAYELCCLACRLLTEQIEAAVAEMRRREARPLDTNKLVAQDTHHVTTPTTNSDDSVPVEMLDVSGDTQSVPPEDVLGSDEQTSPVRPTQQLPLATVDGDVAGAERSPTSVVAVPTPGSPQTPAEILSKLECNLRGKLFCHRRILIHIPQCLLKKYLYRDVY